MHTLLICKRCGNIENVIADKLATLKVVRTITNRRIVNLKLFIHSNKKNHLVLAFITVSVFYL